MKQVKKELKLAEVRHLFHSGMRIMVGGFAERGCPRPLVDELIASDADDLVIISNDLGLPDAGLGILLKQGRIRTCIGSFYNWNPNVAIYRNEGKVHVDLNPQGTFAERIRAGGAGIPAFYTATSVGTPLEEGKEVREFDGKKYVMETGLTADIALIQAYKADTLGNLVYYKTAENFNSMMATAAKVTVALVDEIVEPGELAPNMIRTPHLHIDYIVRREK